MGKIFNWMKQEAIHALPSIIYFLCAFNFIHFTGSLVRSSYDQPYFTYLSMSLDALIVAKALLISNSLPFINAFPKKPLIYNIVWKDWIYSIFVFLIWSLDVFLHSLARHDSWGLAWAQFKYKLTTPVFISGLLWVWVLLAVYVVCHEVIMAVGKDKILRLIFG